MKENLLKDKDLLLHGYKIFSIAPPLSLLRLAENKDWGELDKLFFKLIEKNGYFFLFFQRIVKFEHIEFIINHRVAGSNEEGIWHDDGSRLIAFSLSLNQNVNEISGGELKIRHKDHPDSLNTIMPLSFGNIILFLTGEFGFDHKVCRVEKGERTTIAGWLS